MVDKTEFFISELEGITARRVWNFIYTLRTSYGVPAYITEGRRSLARQFSLYAIGRFTSGPVVTKTLRGKHPQGKAIDIALWGYRTDAVPLKVWQAIGEIGEHFGLKWGGRWKMRDYVHFET